MAGWVRSLADAPGGAQVRAQLRPLGGPRAPLVLEDPFARALVARRDATLQQLGWEFCSGDLEDVPEAQRAVEIQRLTLDRLLLALHDSLLHTQAEQWTAEGVSNLDHDDTYELARWFLRGQDVGRKPIFQGFIPLPSK